MNLKIAVIILVSLALEFEAFGQENIENKNQYFVFGFGIEAHDKRLFNFSNADNLIALHPELIGTYKIEGTYLKSFSDNLTLGLAIVYKETNFTRPFDHARFGTDNSRVLRNFNSYNLWQIGISNLFPLFNNEHFKVNLNSRILVNIHTFANNHRSIDENYPFSMFNFIPDGLEIRPEFNYSFQRYQISLGIRVIRIAVRDTIIFGDWLRDDFSAKLFDFHNPVNVNLLLGYNF